MLDGTCTHLRAITTLKNAKDWECGECVKIATPLLYTASRGSST
jgi:hypothetical protein